MLLQSGVAGSEGRPRAHHLLSGELGQGRVDGLGGLEEDALNGSLVGQGAPAQRQPVRHERGRLWALLEVLCPLELRARNQRPS